MQDVFPNQFQISPPQEGSEKERWKEMVSSAQTEKIIKENKEAIEGVLSASHLFCPHLPPVAAMKLEKGVIEKLVGLVRSLAVGESASPPQVDENGRLIIPQECFLKALDMIGPLNWQSCADGQSLPQFDYNDVERVLLGEVVKPSEMTSGFDDIGALEEVKEALREVVLLPLMRPELFQRGALNKPVKGVLLFGPPGTGKNPFGKSGGKEAGANFLNISTSVISSKWFGDAEKLTRGVFTLAKKLAPAVVFIDEVDSLLGARGGIGEHEATRKMRNELMTCWDGLKTADDERVLVLAATNRPFDLDEAVIRRMPRRILVPLPDTDNRVKILRVLLGKEEVETDFDWKKVAEVTEGYSGSDLKNLCVAAAYRPIREVVAQEKASGQWEWTNAAVPRGSQQRPPTTLRPLRLEDFLLSMAQVGASVSPDAQNQVELQKWNEQYGEGGSRKKQGFGFTFGMNESR